jgi:hypothetical protein
MHNSLMQTHFLPPLAVEGSIIADDVNVVISTTKSFQGNDFTLVFRLRNKSNVPLRSISASFDTSSMPSLKVRISELVIFLILILILDHR